MNKLKSSLNWESCKPFAITPYHKFVNNIFKYIPADIFAQEKFILKSCDLDYLKSIYEYLHCINLVNPNFFYNRPELLLPYLRRNQLADQIITFFIVSMFC